MTTNCDMCISNDVCAFKKECEETIINTKHPNIIVKCGYYHGKLGGARNRDCIDIRVNDTRNRVLNWRNENPSGKKIDCSKALRLSRPTVNKYWDCLEKED